MATAQRTQPRGGLDAAAKLELYYYMRLTRTLEERLVNLYRQTKVVGGLFRSLGQEADAVGSAYALDRDRGDIRHRRQCDHRQQSRRHKRRRHHQ